MAYRNNLRLGPTTGLGISPIKDISKVKFNPNLKYTAGTGSLNNFQAPNFGNVATILGGASGIYNEFQNLNNPGTLNFLDTNAYSKGDLGSRMNQFSTTSGYNGQLGRTSNAGTGLSMGAKGASAGAAVGSFLGPVGGLVGGAIGGIGGLVSGIFGSKNANKKKARIEEAGNIKTMNEFQGQNNTINTNNIRGWQSNQLALGGVLPMTEEVNKLLALRGNNLFAYGGQFTNGVGLVGAGGTHEANPLGGVPVGIGEDGEPNLVEENEVMWNNFVFSDRIKVKGAEDIFLDKKLDRKSFAEAATKVAEESDERPHDIISRRGLEDGLSKLASLQESIKTPKQSEANIFADGGPILGQPLPTRKDAPWLFDTSGIQTTRQEEEAPQQAPKMDLKSELAEAYRSAGITNEDMIHFLIQQDILESRLNPQAKNNFSNITAGSNYQGATKQGNDSDRQGNPITQNFREYDSVLDYAKDKIKLLTNSYGFNQNDSPEVFAAKLDGDNPSGRRWAEDPQYAQKMVQSFGGDYSNMPASFTTMMSARGTTQSPTADTAQPYTGPINKPSTVGGIGVSETPVVNKGRGSTLEDRILQNQMHEREMSMQKERLDADVAERGRLEAIAGKSDALRYAPLLSQAGIIGDLMTTPADTLNLGRIAPETISDRLTYSPMDSEYLVGKIGQQGAGMARALVDTAGGNRGSAQAGLLAMNRSTGNAIGDALLQTKEYNDAERERVAGFNRSTNMFNAQQDLTAQQFNTDAFNKESEWNLQARAAKNNMIRQGVASIGTTLGQIGTENRYFNMAPLISGGFDSKGRAVDTKALGGKLTYYKKRIK